MAQPMTDDEVLHIVATELDNAAFADTEVLASQMETALAYYLGAPNGKEVVGRSTVTSTDVADAVEWVMPQVMEALTGQSDIVEFVPVGRGDVAQAQLETEYVYDTLMTDNDGFVVLYTFVKDALLQRNGIIKVTVEDSNEYETYEYTGMSKEQLEALASDPTVSIPSLYIDEDEGTFDVTVAKTLTTKRVVVTNVPIERFRVNASHNSLSLRDARFTAHIEQVTMSDLTAMGFDDEVLERIPSYASYRSEYRFRLQNETAQSVTPKPADETLEPVEIAECYMRLDYDGNGIAELMKVTVASDGDNPSVLLSVEKVSCMPWVTTTAIIMGHKFQGLSMFDRLKEIQDQKTALIRNLLDNFYLQNNQRVIAVENQVNLDDLMVSRPGGVIRAKRIDAVAPFVTPQIAAEAFTLLDYLDRTRAGRSGVDADGTASPKSMGDAVGSEGVDRLLNAKEALVGLIVRTIAETGVKPLCCMIRDLLHRHVDAIRDFEFRGRWVQTNPSDWIDKRKTRVRVGSGTGDKAAKTAALAQVIEMQKEAMVNSTPIVTLPKMYNALEDLCKLTGLLSASKYFVDPESDEGKELSKQQSAQQAEASQQDIAAKLMELKMAGQFAEAEQLKAQSMLENSRIKAQEVTVRGQLERARLQNDQLKSQFEQVKALQESVERGDKLALERLKVLLDSAIKLTDIEAKTQTEQNDNLEQNRETVSG